MRTRAFTALCVVLLWGSAAAQSVPKASLHADRVVVFKGERTLQLMSQGKVIKTYKVALGGDPIGPKAGRRP